MIEGFVVDVSHGTMAASSWIEGAPEKSVFTGVKVGGKGRSRIASWRCRSCGFIEHYAPAAPDLSHETEQRKQVLLTVVVALAVLAAVLGAVLALRS